MSGGDELVWVGITGHRVLDGADEAVLRERIRDVFAGIGGDLGVVSPLAEGADRWVAQEALAQGRRLRCVLPFAVADYREDFAEVASKGEFDALLSSAEDVRELSADPSTSAGRTAGYVTVGRAVVEASDVLIAIWDGQPANGPGGTADVVDIALAQRVPTIWITSMAPHAVGHWLPGPGGWTEVHREAFYARVRQ